MSNVNLDKEISTVALDLYVSSGRIEGCDLDIWLEAERIVKTLRIIAGDEDKRTILINVPKR